MIIKKKPTQGQEDSDAQIFKRLFTEGNKENQVRIGTKQKQKKNFKPWEGNMLIIWNGRERLGRVNLESLV